MNSSVNETGLYAELNQRLGVSLADNLLEHAFTHRSYAYENGGLPTNERLEFLGDSVLGVIVTESLFRNHPDLSEGRLAKLRAAVVNMRALANISLDPGSILAWIIAGFLAGWLAGLVVRGHGFGCFGTRWVRDRKAKRLSRMPYRRSETRRARVSRRCR